MQADTPPESIHMMEAHDLAAEDIYFFIMRESGHPIGMGALKRLSQTEAEIKSMHISAECRGKGLAKRMLEHLIDQARELDFTKVSLETGAQPSFEPARKLYEKAGFSYCPPFHSYTEDPNSVFMTLALG